MACILIRGYKYVMNDLRHYINIIETRSHPELNPKPITVDILKQYIKKYGKNKLFVHFNDIEKVGINFNPKSTYGPIGIYAYPIEKSLEIVFYAVHDAKWKYANVLLPKKDINILNLDTVSEDKVRHIFDATFNLVKKNNVNLANELPMWYTSNRQENFLIILHMCAAIAKAKGNTNRESIYNIILRSLGYDAVFDTSRILNSNPHQIIFLTPTSFEVIETIPLRLTSP
jgi:hypothetical protein